MPSTNTSAATATAIITLPYSTTQDVSDTSGPAHTVWFTYTATSRDTLLSAWAFSSLTSNYTPRITVWTGDAASPTAHPYTVAADNVPLTVPVTNGETYYFRVSNVSGNTPPDTVLSFSLQTSPREDIPVGAIVIPDDTPGFPAVWVNATTGAVLRAIDFPAGEMGAALPDGTLLVEASGYSELRLYDADITPVTTVSFPASGAHVGGITTNGTDTFYVGMPGGGITPASLYTYSAGAVLGGTSWTLDSAGLSGIGVSSDDLTLFYHRGSEIKRWDLNADSALSDFAAAVSSYTVIRDILVLSDDTLIVGYFNAGVDYFARHYDTDGSTLSTYNFGTDPLNRLAHAVDNPTSFWAWFKIDGYAILKNIRISDGTVLTESPPIAMFTNGTYQPDASATPERFGVSTSCPLWAQLTAITAPVDPGGGGEDPPAGEVPPSVDPPPGPCCGSAGPGGSPTPTGYGGSGPEGPGESLPTPRKVPAGGPEPTYSPCATFGGVPATAADQSNAQDLTTCKTPLVHMKWILPDGSVRRYGQLAFTSGNGQSVAERVLKWGPVSQVLSDRHGSFQANQFTVTLSDYDRAIRTILSTASTQYIDGKEVEILIETAANAELSVNPLVLSRGIVTKWRYNRDLTVDLTVTDPLGYRWSSVSLDRPLPRRVVRVELFPNCPENTTGRAMPIIYGEMSDDYTWSVQPERIPVGICPVIYVGPANTISASGIPDSTWHAFLIAGHAIPCVSSIFGSNLDPDGEQPIRMASDRIGVEFLLPGNGADYYYDITGTDGVTERVSLLFARGPVADAHIDGRVPITINPYGIEDVGDGTGDCITDMAYQFQHFLCYWVVQDYLTGNWGSVPTFTDGTAKVRTSSFAACRTTHNARVSEGYFGSMYMGDQKPARDWAKEFAISGDMRPGVNNHGQILAITFNEQQDTSGLTTFTDEDHVLQASFEIDPEPDEIFNIYTYEYGPEPATGRVSGLAQTIRRPSSITNHGERVAQALLYRGTRRKATADDVANRTLVRSGDAPTTVTFTLDLRGAALSLGQLIRVTHYQGIGATGWTDRVLMITRITVQPDADAFITEIECEDMNDLLIAGGEVFALDSGQLDLGKVA